MTLTLDEVVDLMLEGSAMTEPCEGNYMTYEDHRTCAIGAAAYAYVVRYGVSITFTNIMEAVEKIETVLNDSNIIFAAQIADISDAESRDAAIAFVKDRL